MLFGVYTPMFFLSDDTIHNIVYHTDMWCVKNLGYKKGLVIEITKQKFWTKPCFGGYDEINRHLYVYTNRCDDIGDLIKTILHEYTHHLQDLRNYDKLLKKYGYDNHPHELEANEVAFTHYKSVWKEIKNRI